MKLWKFEKKKKDRCESRDTKTNFVISARTIDADEWKSFEWREIGMRGSVRISVPTALGKREDKKGRSTKRPGKQRGCIPVIDIGYPPPFSSVSRWWFFFLVSVSSTVLRDSLGTEASNARARPREGEIARCLAKNGAPRLKTEQPLGMQRCGTPWPKSTAMRLWVDYR